MKRRLQKLLFSLAVVFLSASPCFAVTLPCVAGEDLGTAESNLSASGFVTYYITNDFSDTIASGSVVQTSPACGADYVVTTAVNISVSIGSLSAAGATVFGTAFSGILYAFALGIFFGLFVKLTNRS